MLKVTWTAFLLCLYLNSAWSAPLKPAKSVASFTAVATPGNLKIVGDTPSELLQPAQVTYNQKTEQLSGTIKVKLEQLDTGLELRNSHMKHKYLKVVEFPEAVFTFAPVKCPAAGGTFSIPGTLTLHGKSRPFQAEATLKEDGSWVDLSLKAVVKMSDFALESPQFMGVKVRDEVAISLEYRGSL